MDKFFNNIVGKLPISLACAFLNFSAVYQSIYYVRELGTSPIHPGPSPIHPGPKQVQWCVAWLITMFNRKHIFAGSQNVPTQTDLRKSLVAFENKVKWKYVHRHDQVNSENPFLRKMPRRNYTCRSLVPPEVSGLLNSVRAAVVGGCESVEVTSADCRRHNFPALARVALRVLQRSGIKVMQTDKDGGSAACQQ